MDRSDPADPTDPSDLAYPGDAEPGAGLAGEKRRLRRNPAVDEI
jgi:hypothetical protein